MLGRLAGNRRRYQWAQVVQDMVLGLKEKNQTFLMRYSFQAVIYAVWYERNQRRVGESPQPVSYLLVRLDKLVRNRITSLKKKKGGKYEKAMEVWFGSR